MRLPPSKPRSHQEEATTQYIDSYMVRCLRVYPFTHFKRNCYDLVREYTVMLLVA